MAIDVNYKEFKDFAKQMERQLSSENQKKFMEDCCKELTSRLLSRAIKKTPVGKVNGGNLRRGWSADQNKNIEVVKSGGNYQCTIINPTEYASYVEYGHRTKGGTGWVKGQFFLTISEQEVERLAPRLLEKRLMEYLREAMK